MKRHTDFLLQFFGKTKHKVDIPFLSKVLNLEDRLKQIFVKDRPDLGMKYRDNGKSLWANDYLAHVKNILKSESVEFEVGFDQSDLVLNEVNLFFTEQIEKLHFFE